MFGLTNWSLMTKLMVFFVLVALVPLGIVGYLAYRNSQAGLLAMAFDNLDNGREARTRDLHKYLREALDHTRLHAESPRMRRAMGILASSGASSDADSEQRKATTKDLDGFFASYLRVHDEHQGYDDILLVDAHDGKIVYSAGKGNDLGENVAIGSLKASGLGRLWERVVKTKEPAVEDFRVYEPTGKPAAFVGFPVFCKEGVVCGVLAQRLSTKLINAIMKPGDAMGKTGEVYLVGEDLLMRSSSRVLGDKAILEQKIDTEAAKQALAGQTGKKIIEGFRRKDVISSYSPVGLGADEGLGTNFRWAILAEIDLDEARKPAIAFRNTMILVGLGLALVVALIGFFLARGIARPITAISAVATEVSDGDLTVKVPKLKRGDEIGSLAQSFDVMLVNMKDQIGMMVESVKVLSTSSAEISSTATQLSQTTSKASAAVSETATTVEEVKQSAKLSGEKAKSVAQTSQGAVATSDAGRRATEETVDRMNLIKDQMQSIGETVVKLSEQSQAIEEIISTVQDLADQSNLLAVNASIEAARAGEQGKGFAVVAHEIKSLADQSKEATDQVRTILDDTRRWVSAVVMATEQGGKAVEAGVEQSIRAGEAIKTLAQSVAESAQSASVIDSSSEQQFLGVEEVATAMSNVERAMQQNVAGSSQLESAALKLQDIGETLKKLADRYKM